MPTDPERPIEKLLRESAKRRREDAGAPLELHPATRQMLQGEVARQYARASSTPKPIQALLPRLWTKMAWGLASVTVLIVAAVLIMPVFNRPRSQTRFVAKNDLGRDLQPSIAPPATATPALAKTKGTQRLEENNQLVTESVEQLKSKLRVDLKQNTTDQLQPSERESELAATAKDRSQTVVRFNQTEVAKNSSPNPVAAPLSDYAARGNSLARSPTAATAPQGIALAHSTGATGDSLTAGLSSNEPVATPDGGSNQKFVKVTPAQTKSALPVDISSPSAVLVSFQVEQVGPQVRIIDQDGSLYTGSWEMEKGTPAVSSAVPPASASSESASEPNRKRAALLAARRSNQPASPPAYSFRVTGTNQTLQQQIIFTGSFLPANAVEARTIATRNVSRAFGGATPALSNQMSVPLLNSRISGRASIGGQREIEINALPAKP